MKITLKTIREAKQAYKAAQMQLNWSRKNVHYEGQLDSYMTDAYAHNREVDDKLETLYIDTVETWVCDESRASRHWLRILQWTNQLEYEFTLSQRY